VGCRGGGDYPEIILLEEILADSFKLKGVGNREVELGRG